MKKVKNILFRVRIEGQGVVNFDSSDARWNVRGYGNPMNKSAYSNDNVKIAKSSYRYTGETDGEGNPVVKRTLKISSDCLRHAIFEKDYDVQNGRIMVNDTLLASFISSPAALLRGYTEKISADVNLDTKQIEDSLKSMARASVRTANYLDGRQVAPFDELNILARCSLKSDLLDVLHKDPETVLSRSETIADALGSNKEDPHANT